jgi:hypothetical protein
MGSAETVGRGLLLLQNSLAGGYYGSRFMDALWDNTFPMRSNEYYCTALQPAVPRQPECIYW